MDLDQNYKRHRDTKDSEEPNEAISIVHETTPSMERVIMDADLSLEKNPTEYVNHLHTTPLNNTSATIAETVDNHQTTTTNEPQHKTTPQITTTKRTPSKTPRKPNAKSIYLKEDDPALPFTPMAITVDWSDENVTTTALNAQTKEAKEWERREINLQKRYPDIYLEMVKQGKFSGVLPPEDTNDGNEQ